MEAEIQALKQENQLLADRVQQLKQKLGLDVIEREQERARVRSLFELFDADRSGFIDKQEFQGLAAQCGQYLASSAVDKAVATIDVSGDGKISFDEFFAWIQSQQQGEPSTDAQEQDLLALKLKLQTGALVRSVTAFKHRVTSQLAAAPVSLANDVFKVKVGTETLGLQDAPLSVGVTYYNDEATAAAFKEECNSTDDALVLALDYSIRDDASDELVGELAGALDPVLDMLPLPFPIEHEQIPHVDESGQRCLRLVFRSSFDPMGHASEMLGGIDPTAFIKRLSVQLQSSFDLDRLLDADFSLVSALRFRASADVEIDRAVVDLLKSVAGGDAESQVFLVVAKMFREFETVLTLHDPLAALSDGGVLAESVTMTLDHAVLLGLQNQLRQVQSVPPELIRQEVPPPMLNYVRLGPKCVRGFRGVQVQSRNAGVQLLAKGIDIMKYMPQI